MADLENGLFSGSNYGWNGADPSISHLFLTAIVKGESNQWAIRGGDAMSGSLSTFYSGGRPSGYNPMSKEGAIILGIGGNNSHGAQGTFYESVMTSGYPSDSTEDAVQADIVAAKYSSGSVRLTVIFPKPSQASSNSVNRSELERAFAEAAIATIYCSYRTNDQVKLYD